MGETSTSPAKVIAILQSVPMSSEIVRSRVVQKDHDLTVAVAENDCVMTSSEEDVDDLNTFVNEKLRFMTEKGLEQLVGDGSMKVEELLCGGVAAVTRPNVGSVGNFGTEEVDRGRTTSVCPGLTPSGNVGASGCEVSSRERDEMDRVLREELSGSRVTSTPVKCLWPIYRKWRSSVLGGHEAPSCKSIRLEVTDTIGAHQSGNFSRSCLSEVTGGVEDSD